MSVDATVSVYFPASEATAALRTLRGMLAPMPGGRKAKTIQIVSPDGETVALPFHDGLGIDARKTYHLAEEGSIEIETLIDPEKDRDERAIFPVILELNLGSESLEVSFTSIATGLVHLLFLPSVRSRVGELLDEAKGIAAVSLAMGEWRTYARDPGADEELEVPEGRSRDEVDVDEFAAFLADRRRSGA